jgi:hypothetical protein
MAQINTQSRSPKPRRREIFSRPFLDSVKWILTVFVNTTFFTERGSAIAIGATVDRSVSLAMNASWVLWISFEI